MSLKNSVESRDQAAAAEAEETKDSFDIRFVTNTLNPTEIAVVTAVITTCLNTRNETAARLRSSYLTASDWDRQRRGLRSPLQRKWNS